MEELVEELVANPGEALIGEMVEELDKKQGKKQGEKKSTDKTHGKTHGETQALDKLQGEKFYHRPKESGALDHTHDFVSNSVVGLSQSVDSLFGDEVIATDKESRLKVQLISKFAEGEAAQYGVRTSLRLVFPRMEKKLDLVVRDLSDSFREEEREREKTKSPAGCV